MIKSCISPLLNYGSLLSKRILDDLDQRVDSTYDRLKRGSKRLQQFILANEGIRPPLSTLKLDSKSNYCIILLIVILFILMFMVILI
jgi:hypothetical protein